MNYIESINNYTLYGWDMGIVYIKHNELLSKYGCSHHIIDSEGYFNGRNCGLHDCNEHNYKNYNDIIVNYYKDLRHILRKKYNIDNIFNKHTIDFLNKIIDYNQICVHVFSKGFKKGEMCKTLNCAQH